MKKSGIENWDTLSNREKKLYPRKVKSYCFSCDMALVRPGGKCPNCGSRMTKRRLLR